MTRGLSHTITGTTLPVTDTQSPSVSPAWPRRHRPVSRPHVPGAGPPHAPCHPQSRADTVQTPPLRAPRAAAAPRRRRPVSHPHPGRGPSFPGPGRLWGPPTPQTSSSADACPPRTAGPRVAAGRHAGLGDTRGPGARKTPGQDAEAERGAGWGLRHPPRRRTSSETRGARGRHSGPHPSGPGRKWLGWAPRVLLTWPPRSSSSSRFPGQRGARYAPAAAQAARLLNESSAGPGRCAAPPPRVTASGPAPNVRARARVPASPLRETAKGPRAPPPGCAALCRHLPRPPGVAGA